MPGILCKCAEHIKIGEIPSPFLWLAISDVDFDQYHGRVETEVLYERMLRIVECPKCGRLWVLPEDPNLMPICFRKEL
jgi:hypothetical protein